jgi:predicted nucleic acid-binding protein
MNADVFLDTNILIYAYDSEAGKKHQTAKDIVYGYWESGGALISTQVIQEFYVNVTHKIPSPLPKPIARSIIEQYRVWPVVGIGMDTILRSTEIQERYEFSFWDSLIVSAAEKGKAKYILTEDLPHDQLVAGIKIHNPFN